MDSVPVTQNPDVDCPPAGLADVPREVALFSVGGIALRRTRLPPGATVERSGRLRALTYSFSPRALFGLAGFRGTNASCRVYRDVRFARQVVRDAATSALTQLPCCPVGAGREGERVKAQPACASACDVDRAPCPRRRPPIAVKEPSAVRAPVNPDGHEKHAVEGRVITDRDTRAARCATPRRLRTSQRRVCRLAARSRVRRRPEGGDAPRDDVTRVSLRAPGREGRRYRAPSDECQRCERE